MDGEPGDGHSRRNTGPYYYFTDLFAESRPELKAILASPEGQAAVKDVPNFATGGVSFVYSDNTQIV